MQVLINYFGSLSVKSKSEFIQPLRDLGPFEDNVGRCSYLDTRSAMTVFATRLHQQPQHWWEGSAACIEPQLVQNFVSTCVVILEAAPSSVILIRFSTVRSF